jgi:hypothetical protein
MFCNILQCDSEASGTDRFFKQANKLSIQSCIQNTVHIALL